MIDFTKLKTERKNQDITQAEMSDYVCISQGYLSEIENNKKKPSFYVLEKIIQKLGKEIQFYLIEKI